MPMTIVIWSPSLVRRDGDSRFGENNKFETFPALSLGWNVHNEAFMQDADVLSRLKVRFSTGSLGTTSFLGSYDALSLLDPSATVLWNRIFDSGKRSKPGFDLANKYRDQLWC